MEELYEIKYEIKSLADAYYSIDMHASTGERLIGDGEPVPPAGQSALMKMVSAAAMSLGLVALGRTSGSSLSIAPTVTGGHTKAASTRAMIHMRHFQIDDARFIVHTDACHDKPRTIARGLKVSFQALTHSHVPRTGLGELW